MPSAIMLSLPTAFLFGYAAQRSSLCAVDAIHLVMKEKAFGPFLSFFRVSAWVILISLPAWWLWPAARVGEIYAFGFDGLVGAALFGVGATINGGCNFGTLIRFATGDASFVATAAAGALGVWVEGTVFRTPVDGLIGPTGLAHPGPAAIVLLFLAALWCVSGLISPGSRAASSLRLRVAPMILGLTGGALYLLNGAWAYTLDVGRLVHPPAPGEMPGTALLVMTAVTCAGAVAAACVDGVFHPRLALAVLPYRFCGGALMGFGAALAPGGNAVLILHGIPTVSPHAIPDYAALCFGIIVMLTISKRLRSLAALPHRARTVRA
jgi:uncharacterized protein